MGDISDFERDLNERLELPLDSPSGLTGPFVLFTVLSIALVLWKGALPLIVLGCFSLYFIKFLHWSWSRRRVRKFFISMALAAYKEHPEVDPENVIVGSLLAWRGNGLPAVRIRRPVYYC